MILDRVGLLAIDSSRTRAYLAALLREGLVPAQAILMADGKAPATGRFPAVPYFDNHTPALDTVQRAGIPLEVLATDDPNSPAVLSAVKRSTVDVFVYSGPGGAILRRQLFSVGKRFLHVHPGLVPRYRGSTTVYYSLLIDGDCGVSAIFLDEKIDSGPVLGTRVYPPPEDRTTIDYGYDPYIRSDLLVEVLKEYRASGRFKVCAQGVGTTQPYFIMHPVLKHVAILSQRGNSSQSH